MSRLARRFALVCALMLALAPAIAQARVGDGASMGSRGSRTYSAPPVTGTAPGGAQQFNRSLTPNYGSAPATPYGQGMGYNRGGLFGGGFTSGLLGGLIGAGLGGMLFGRGFFGFGGFGGFIGFLIQMALLYFVVRWLFRMFTGGGRPAFAGPGMFGRMANPMGGPTPMGGGGGGAPGNAIAIQPADYQLFEQALKAIQAAWSAHDLNGLGTMATPEMLSYFNEQISQQVSSGVRNMVSDVRLDKGDLAEAWAENGREYATVAMRFSMIDATYDQTGRVVDGSATERVTATELWTFLRSPGGRWILSAIQQAA